MAEKAKAATPAWETFLERGRLEEKKGRMAPAERAYRGALRANPSFNSLEREFARFLESRGRPKESESHLLRAMELGWPREEGEASLARLREKPSEGGGAGWPEVFSALLCERKYHEAFRLGDAMLKKSARVPNANSFMWPWWHKVPYRGFARKREFCARELKHVRKAGAGGEFPGWFAYCRGVLLQNIGRRAQARAEYERLRRLCSARYSLMHLPFVSDLLAECDFKWTIETCRALVRKAPEYWWFRCRLAEAYMAEGDVDRGLREFERAAAGACDAQARQSIMTWHGAALLWAGRYRRAVAKLDGAAVLGAKTWVDCWRGGAYLKLGEFEKSLADLDRAVKRDSQDHEAYLWRGEARRLLGRHREALRDLDRAIALDANCIWGRFNRALVRGALGDAPGATADFAMIPGEVVAAIRRAPKAREGAGLSPKEMRGILEAGLKRAKGIRRPENYLNAIWMGRGNFFASRPHD